MAQRLGILSDVHANREALTAVLRRLRQLGATRLLCLGDMVGLNAEPGHTLEQLRQAEALCIAGNHDRMAARLLPWHTDSNEAAYAMRRTARDLSPQDVRFLQQLPIARRLPDLPLLMIHGGLDDVTRYLYSAQDVAAEGRRVRQRHAGLRWCLYGHTHERALFRVVAGRAQRMEARGTVRLDGIDCVFLNPGAVDRPGAAQAALLDPLAASVTFVDVPYDHLATRRRSQRAGYRIGPLADWGYSRQRELRLLRSAVARRGVRGALARLGVLATRRLAGGS